MDPRICLATNARPSVNSKQQQWRYIPLVPVRGADDPVRVNAPLEKTNKQTAKEMETKQPT